MEALLREIDVLLVASPMDPACRIDDEAEAERTMARQDRHAFNPTGHPALSIMCGSSANGLPLGMQLVGRCFDEATVYRAVAACERAAAWKNLRPAL